MIPIFQVGFNSYRLCLQSAYTLPGPWAHWWGYTNTIGLFVRFYQHYGTICEVFNNSKDVLHPVAELQLVHLREKHHNHTRNVSRHARQVSRLGSYIASQFWRAASTLMVIEHAWIVVDWAIPDQREVRYFGFHTEVSTSSSSAPCDHPCECTRAVQAPYTQYRFVTYKTKSKESKREGGH